MAEQGSVRHLLGGWGAPLGIELRADGLSVLMRAATATVGTERVRSGLPSLETYRIASDCNPARSASMTIWIDADAAPRAVKDIVFRAAKRLEIPTLLVANERLATPLNNPHVSAVWVQGGPDVADRHITDHAAEGDVVVTADIPLAAALVEKGVVVLDPRGEEYSEENVRERLSIRDFMASLRDSGVDTGGPKPYGPREKRAFAGALDRVLTAARRRS